MNFFDQIVKIERIDWLIRMKATGTPSQLARRVDVSESTLRRLIKIMMETGAPIKYNSNKNSFVYLIQKISRDSINSSES